MSSMTWDLRRGGLALARHSAAETALQEAVTRYCLQAQEQGAALDRVESLLAHDAATLLRQGALAVEAANAVLDEEGRQMAAILDRQGKPLVCGPGCHGCCHQLVLCQPFEAQRIAALLRACPDHAQAFKAAYVRWDADSAALRHSYLAWARKAYGEGEDDGSHTLNDYYLPCPLLDEDRRCRVYAARPYGCRTSVAFDPLCAVGFDPQSVGGTSPDTEHETCVVLPGSRNMHFSLYTVHQEARKTLMDLLLRRWREAHGGQTPATDDLPMPEMVRALL